ncbi:YqiA/YcfP family alpha/beta fold hydrolase [Pseudomonadota bacterium]
MKLFYYFNGFNSAILEDFSGSPKIVAAADFARKNGFHFVPVSISFRLAVDHKREILETLPAEVTEVVFCGSSMGGWFARVMQLSLLQSRPGIRTAAIGFNPAFDLPLHEDALLGSQVNYVTSEEYEWTAQHSRQLGNMEEGVDYDADQAFYVYCDKNDEVIPWKSSEARHREISRFIAYPGGCHSFHHFNEALADFAGHYFTQGSHVDRSH